MSNPEKRPTILLTGFGPFPGVPDNVSGALVEAVAAVAQQELPLYRIVAHILPTQWQEAPRQISQLLTDLMPILTLHFGVARGICGFRIETQGANTCLLAEDAAGLQPLGATLIDGGEEAICATLPIAAIVQRLENLGIKISRSDDAGGYLCNAVLYHSLAANAASKQDCRVGFIHVPDLLTPPFMSFDEAVTGSLEIIRTSLDIPAPLRAR